MPCCLQGVCVGSIASCVHTGILGCWFSVSPTKCVCACVCVCVCVRCPIISTSSIAFANIHHLSTALFALQQCLDSAPRGLVCDAQIFQIMLKLRGSTMMRPNHEFFCSVALSPGFRNCATRGGGARAPIVSRIPGPFSCASLRGGPTGQVRCAVGGRGGRKTHGCRWSSCAGRG